VSSDIVGDLLGGGELFHLSTDIWRDSQKLPLRHTDRAVECAINDIFRNSGVFDGGLVAVLGDLCGRSGWRRMDRRIRVSGRNGRNGCRKWRGRVVSEGRRRWLGGW